MTRAPLALAATMLLLLGTTPAESHPHVWIDAEATLHLTPDGRLSAIGIVWTFDELYSEDSVVDLPGKTRDDLRPMVTQAMHDLIPWLYFTDVRADGVRQAFGTVKTFDAVWRDGRMAYSFQLPLDTPIDPSRQTVELRLYDPTYYIDIAVPEDHSVTIEPTGSGCTMTRAPAPEQPDILILSDAYQTVPIEPGGEGIGGDFSEVWRMDCP